MKTLAAAILALLCLLPPALRAQQPANLWHGTFESKYGQLRLIQDGRRVYGDYHDAGYFEARTADGQPHILRGTFQRKDGQWGFFQFTMNQDRRRFTGAWAYEQPPTAQSDNWTGNKTSDTPGSLVNAVGKKFYWPKPYENRLPIVAVDWMAKGENVLDPTPAPTPAPNKEETKPAPKPKPLENVIVRVRLYGIQGELSKLFNPGSAFSVPHAVSGSFYVNTFLIDRRGGQTRLNEMNGVPEMIWERDAHNPHKARLKNPHKIHIDFPGKDGEIIRSTDHQKTQTPPPIVRNMAEWERKSSLITGYIWDNLFNPALEVRFQVPLAELNNPDKQLRIQLTGHLFEVGRNKKEEPRGRAEVIWLYPKDPMKRSGDFKTLNWNPSRGDSGIKWHVHAAASFIYPGQ